MRSGWSFAWSTMPAGAVIVRLDEKSAPSGEQMRCDEMLKSSLASAVWSRSRAAAPRYVRRKRAGRRSCGQRRRGSEQWMVGEGC